MLSRVADNLYWMTRYLERAENTARVMDVYLNLILDSPMGNLPDSQQVYLLDGLGIATEMPNGRLANMVYQLTFNADLNGSIIHSLTTARENARQVREQISSEMWMQINSLYLDIKQADKSRTWTNEPHVFYMQVKQGAHLFQGITDATMLYNQGWHFIRIGRYLERIVNLMSALKVYMRPRHPLSYGNGHGQIADHYFEMLALLKSVTAFEAYCKAYSPDVDRNTVLEFLLFSPEFPHAARFCVDQMLDSINALTDATLLHKNNRLYRLAGRLQSGLSYDDLEEVLEGDLGTYFKQIQQQAFRIHEALFNTFITYSIDAALK